ncbi:MAG TPA: hypothetical protein VFT06_00345 [Flavisolibacter sp.]|nr:hypothetical protein [Flavisolibacter sp.]
MQNIDIEKFNEVMQHFANAMDKLQSAMWFPEHKRTADYVACRQHLTKCLSAVAELLLHSRQLKDEPRPQLQQPGVSRRVNAHDLGSVAEEMRRQSNRKEHGG